MKPTAIFKYTSLLALTAWLAATVGCSTCSTADKRADRVASVDANPNASNKGYAEFYTLANNFPVPVFILDDRGKPIQVGSVGLHAGEFYSPERNGPMVAEKLRVALPEGTNVFMIEYGGPIVPVVITAGQVTPVEIDYALLDRVTQNLVYRADVRVFKPTPK